MKGNKNRKCEWNKYIQKNEQREKNVRKCESKEENINSCIINVKENDELKRKEIR